MCTHDGKATKHHLLISRRWAAWVGITLFLACVTLPAYAQEPCDWTTSREISLPEDGVINCTTLNIPTGITITFRRNARNTPVTILASGNVTIAGTISVAGRAGNANGTGGLGGPGGGDGGASGYGFETPAAGTTGYGYGGGGGGPVDGGAGRGGGGGGHAVAGGNGSGGSVAGQGGPRYGAITGLPLVGGSGGGGGGAISGNHGGAGGGGGGAILIASSGTITVNANGRIDADGGSGANQPCSGCGSGGGGGSGGVIRLIANTITGSGLLVARSGGGGGGTYGNGGSGARGYLRVEAFDHSSFNPGGGPSISFALPGPVTLPSEPRLLIASVAGQPAPGTLRGSLLGAPDIVVPASQPNPVTVVIEGANVPLGTFVQVALIPETGARTTFQSAAGLAGTVAASTATAEVTLPVGMCVLTATATFDIAMASARPMFIDGERVDRIEVAATYGGKSEVTYITKSGRRIKKSE